MKHTTKELVLFAEGILSFHGNMFNVEGRMMLIEIIKILENKHEEEKAKKRD